MEYPLRFHIVGCTIEVTYCYAWITTFEIPNLCFMEIIISMLSWVALKQLHVVPLGPVGPIGPVDVRLVGHIGLVGPVGRLWRLQQEVITKPETVYQLDQTRYLL